MIQRLADGATGTVDYVQYWVRKSATSASDIKLYECTSTSSLNMSSSSILQSGCSVVATSTLGANLTEHPRNPSYPDTPIGWASSTFATKYTLDSSKFYAIDFVGVTGTDCNAAADCLWGSVTEKYNYNTAECHTDNTSCTTESRNIYFILNGTAVAPAPSLASLGQFKSDASTTISAGGSTTEYTVVFKGTVSASSSNVRLEIDVLPTSTAFSSTDTVSIYDSALLSSGSVASITVRDLNGSTNYHWRARAINSDNASSSWQYFGTATSTDFTVSAPAVTLVNTYSGTTVSAMATTYAYDMFEFDPVREYFLRDIETSYPTGTAPTLFALRDGDSGVGYATSGNAVSMGGTTYRWIFDPVVRLNPIKRYTLFSNSATNQYAMAGLPSNGDFFLPFYPTGVCNINGNYTCYGNAQFYSGGSGWNFYGYTTTTGPAVPGMQQYETDATTTVPEGATTTQSGTVWLGGVVNDYDGRTVKVQVDVQPTSTSFSSGDSLLETGYVASGTLAVTSTTRVNGSYHWQSRAVDSSGVTSTWQEFGKAGNTDFVITKGSYYAQIKNISGSAWTMRNGSSTSATPLKTLPQDWVVYVATTTDVSGNPVTADNYHWYQVVDPTDSSTGWMAGENSSGTVHYLSNISSQQTALSATSSNAISSSSTRSDAIYEAVNHYYSDTSTAYSLYSSDDDSSHKLSSIFNLTPNSTSMPPVLVYGIAAQETGPSFDNEIVSSDFGHGVMQLTLVPSSSDIYFLQVILNRDASTTVATSGPGSVGNETHHFGPATTDAVKRFQTKYGITNTGNVFYNTRNQLNSMLPTSSIPTSLQFARNLSAVVSPDDVTSTAYDNRGYASGITISPCGNYQSLDSSEFYQKCYGESSTSTPNKYYIPQTSYANQTFKYYANRSQSIYANIKDGLKILRSKWYTWAPCYVGNRDFSAPGYATTTFTCNDRLNILGVWGYNGFVSTSNYLTNVADKVNNIGNYFSSATSSTEWVNKLIIGDAHKVEFKSLSPVEVSAVDSLGRVTGLSNGQIKEEIQDSGYDPDTNSGILLFPSGTSTFKVVGKANDSYGLVIRSNDGSETSTVFKSLNIPVKTGAVHQYSIDFGKIARGERGVTVSIDDNGDGIIDRVVNDIGTISYEAAPDMKKVYSPMPAVPARLPDQPAQAAPSNPALIVQSNPLTPTSTASINIKPSATTATTTAATSTVQ